MLVLNGTEVAKKVKSDLIPIVERFAAQKGRSPHLSVVIVGDDEASHVYVRNKKKACESIGMTSGIYELPAETSQEEVLSLLKKLNADDGVDGILVQFPLPSHISSFEVLKTVAPEKDADGLTYLSLGYFFAGKDLVRPCTPEGVMAILENYNINVEGKRVAVVGRSNIVGKPMAQLMTRANATVTVCHSKTQNIRSVLQESDIVVVAAGKARLFGKDDFKKGAVVVDVGIHRDSSKKLCGDVRFEELDGWVQAATPVPGGVGPMTIASLLKNTCHLAMLRANLK